MKLKHWFMRWCVWPFLALALLTLLANALVIYNARGKTFNDIKQLPSYRVGLVLGTTPRLIGGSVNPYFRHRVHAAADLLLNNKVSYLLVSGDNGTRGYNEPIEFQKALIQLGVPSDKIILDYAGFRTLDSVVRAKKVFGQNRFIIISQKFHNERAIYLAEHHGIEAIGFNAKTVNHRFGWKVLIREYFARVKVFLDIVLNVQPKFLGDSLPIT